MWCTQWHRFPYPAVMLVGAVFVEKEKKLYLLHCCVTRRSQPQLYTSSTLSPPSSILHCGYKEETMMEMNGDEWRWMKMNEDEWRWMVMDRHEDEAMERRAEKSTRVYIHLPTGMHCHCCYSHVLKSCVMMRRRSAWLNATQRNATQRNAWPPSLSLPLMLKLKIVINLLLLPIILITHNGGQNAESFWAW